MYLHQELLAGVTSHNVVDQPCRTEETEYLLFAGILHISIPSVCPVGSIVVIAIVLELLGVIKECFTLRIDNQLAVNDPALIGAVLNSVPEVTVTGDDGITLRLQIFSGLKNLSQPGPILVLITAGSSVPHTSFAMERR